MTQKMHLGIFALPPVTNHSLGAWKHPRHTTNSGGFEWDRAEVWQLVAEEAERARFDLLFFANTEGMQDVYKGSVNDAIRYASQVPRFDAITLMSAIAPATKHLGLGVTVGTTALHPYTTARLLSTFDHLTGGRAGWNVVTGWDRRAAENLGSPHLDHDERYERAEEYMDLCYRLWESWDSDAVVMDLGEDMFADPHRVKEVNFSGKWFKSLGPLNVHRSPQVRPVIIQAGQSSRGIDFAARHAELTFAIQQNTQGMRRYRNAIRERAEAFGRDPDDIKVMFAFQPTVAESEVAAHQKWNLLRSLVSAEAGLVFLSGMTGTDLSVFDRSRPFVELFSESSGNAMRGLTEMYRELSSQHGLTLGEVGQMQGEACGDPQPVGTAEQIADWMQETMDVVGGDGFMLAPAYVPGGVLDFVELVVPVLRRRGLVRDAYRDATFRENLSSLNLKGSSGHEGSHIESR